MTHSVERLHSSSSRAEEQQTKTESTATVNYCVEDPTPEQMMRLQETSLAFWDDPAEDVYVLDDYDVDNWIALEMEE